MGSFVFLVPTPLMSLPLRIAAWKCLSTIAPPIFYIVAAEKDTLKLCRIPSLSLCTDTAVHPLIV